VDLREGEDVLYEGRPSWRALLAFYLYGVIGAAVAGVIVWLVADSAAGGVLVAIGVAALTLVVGYLRRLFTKYLITSRRLRRTSWVPDSRSTCFQAMPASSSCRQMALGTVQGLPCSSATVTST